MTDATTLQELLRRVEGAADADRELDAAAHIAVTDYSHWMLSPDSFLTLTPTPTGHVFVDSRNVHRCDGPVPKYTDSMDHALALVACKLPDWWWCARTDETRGAYCNVGASSEYGSPCFPKYAATPPLAVLAATLSALIAQANAPQERT